MDFTSAEVWQFVRYFSRKKTVRQLFTEQLQCSNKIVQLSKVK